ncbi:Hypothetical protein R9X50_00480100 [Acrodontium crateriforme]|uniref:Uncharacterized protein n=1 Tax=Acrodontium crateriforme TaxID=150365 RepID=A0AAQ3M4X2_9PEZI|nr:Hypothetical protein R9X50_00480100 [Acrodontium crateriforme]
MSLKPMILVDKHIRANAIDETSRSITTVRSESHLIGLKGIIALQSIAWIYFSTFIPGLVSPDAKVPKYQDAFRVGFSPLLWNDTLISTFFILISMRTVCVTFLKDPDSKSYSGTLLRRIFRGAFLLGVASALATLATSLFGPENIDHFKTLLPNQDIPTPVKAPSALAVFNSIFNLFFLNKGWATQAANTFWPSGTLWVAAVAYYQSWTVYILMVFLPYTRAKWHPQGLTLFALGSFWYASWGWYSATGLLLADFAHNAVLSNCLEEGIKIKGDVKLPTFVVAALMAAAGAALKYAFTILPHYKDALLVLHPFIDLNESITKAQYLEAGPWPRLDDWLFVVGVLLLLEALPILRRLLSIRPLIFIGERAFGLFFAQSVVFWTLGIRLWLFLRVKRSYNVPESNVIVLLTCLPTICLCAELFHRVVDMPSRWLAARTYNWLLE